MKKILILNYGLHIAGVSKALVNLANSLAEDNHEVTIKLFHNDFTLAPELDKRVKCELFVKGYFGKKLPSKIYGKIMQLISKLPVEIQYRIVRGGVRYDVEIAYNRGYAATLISHSTNSKANKIAFVHTDFMKNANALAGFSDEKSAFEGYSKFDHVICVSEQAKKSFVERIGDTGNLAVKYNIFDEADIVQKSEACDIPRSKFTVCSVGRISKDKNLELMVDVANVIQRKGLDCDFWIVGDGEHKTELEEYIRKSGVDNITLWGTAENPYPYFRCSDAFLSTSLVEALSSVVVEAMLLGKPVMVTKYTGATEIVGEHGEYGSLMNYDAEQIADEIERLITDDSYYADRKRRALLGSARFSKNNLYAQLKGLL